MNIENDVRLIGNLGDDPTVKYTQGGMAVAKLSLATTSKRKNKDGEQATETQWHRVVFFGRLAEIAGEYLRKGSKIAVSGMIRYGKYEKDGVTHYTTDIACDQMKMLDNRHADGGRTQSQPQPIPRQTPKMYDAVDDDFADDDIPF